MPLYFMPMDERRERRVCRYDAELAPFGVAVLPYGGQMHCLASSACDDATDTTVTSMPDVFRIPSNLDALPVSEARERLRAHLEAVGVPADWFEDQHNWRALVRGVLMIFLLAQRHQGLGAELPERRVLRQLSLDWGDQPIHLGHMSV